ncbi:hypothetical protein VTL71DRAFT_4427, partial [Oculimacula yallundae]
MKMSENMTSLKFGTIGIILKVRKITRKRLSSSEVDYYYPIPTYLGSSLFLPFFLDSRDPVPSEPHTGDHGTSADFQASTIQSSPSAHRKTLLHQTDQHQTPPSKPDIRNKRIPTSPICSNAQHSSDHLTISLAPNL